MDRVKLVVSERTETGTRAVEAASQAEPHPRRAVLGRPRGRGFRRPGARSARRHGHGGRPSRRARRGVRGSQARPRGRHQGHAAGRGQAVPSRTSTCTRSTSTSRSTPRSAIQLEGHAAGVKAGGLLEMVTYEVAVRGLPAAIPEHLTVNVDEIEMGQVVRVKDLVLPDGLSALDDPEEALFHVVPPRGAEEVAAEAVAEEAEPEVVGKGEEQGQSSGRHREAAWPHCAGRPPRPTASSSGSGTRAPSTRAHATTWASRCWTSWRAGTGCPSRRAPSKAGMRPVRWAAPRWDCWRRTPS